MDSGWSFCHGEVPDVQLITVHGFDDMLHVAPFLLCSYKMSHERGFHVSIVLWMPMVRGWPCASNLSTQHMQVWVPHFVVDVPIRPSWRLIRRLGVGFHRLQKHFMVVATWLLCPGASHKTNAAGDVMPSLSRMKHFCARLCFSFFFSLSGVSPTYCQTNLQFHFSSISQIS